MPRYYFDVQNGSSFIDQEGEDFETPEAAKLYASRVAHEIVQERTDFHDAEVIVRDEIGECFRLKVSAG
jgi:hypothetical protein